MKSPQLNASLESIPFAMLRSLFVLLLVLLVAGCADHRYQQPHVYTPPVVVEFKSLQRTNDYSIAVFTMTNVGTDSMWYDGEEREHPARCLEYQDISYSGHEIDGGQFWGDAGLHRYELRTGQSIEFTIIRSQFTGTFRAGVWLGEEKDNSKIEDLIYWSAFVNP